MRALLQRTLSSRVLVDGKTVAEIGPGLTVFACAMAGDDEECVARLARKIANQRIFADDQGKMNRSLLDTGGQCLLVSQFTLAADTRKGNRPSFTTAAEPATGERLWKLLGAELEKLDVEVGYGVFGADMQIELLNDGPVTIWLDTAGQPRT